MKPAKHISQTRSAKRFRMQRRSRYDVITLRDHRLWNRHIDFYSDRQDSECADQMAAPQQVTGKLLNMFGFKKKDKKAREIVLEKTPQTKFVAVAYEGNGQVPYFEKALYYEFYTVVNGRKLRKNMLSMPDKRESTALDTLRKMKTDVVICRGFGSKALHELKRYQIACYTFDGGPGAAFKAYLNGRLEQ